jgi:uncharacterized protein YbjT (DUF2867 family)
MYAIMGATGNIGGRLTHILLKQNQKVRTLGRSEERLQPVVSQGAEAAVGDVADVDFLTAAFKGAVAVFAMIPPAYDAPDFRAYYNKIGTNIVRAIHASGTGSVVFLSSLGAHLPDKTGPVKGLRDVERKLDELDGVNLVILRPTYFMENLLANIGLIKNLGITGSAIRGDRKFAMIATRDIAQVASEYLLKRDFSGRTVRELLGERDVSMDEVANLLGEKIGRPDLKYVQFSADEEKKGLMDYGLSDDASNQMVELNQAISDGLIAANLKRTTENTTPTTIEEFAGIFADIYNKT